MSIPPDVVGIDVSKHTLDVFHAESGRTEQIANTAELVRILADQLAGSNRFVVFEATGDYDRLLRRALETAGVSFARINPGQARNFARAVGLLAKTDRIDARMLAQMGGAVRPPPTEPSDPARERLCALHKRRDQLVAFRQQERTRRSETSDPDLRADLQRHLDWLDREIAEFNARIAQHIAQAPALKQANRLIRSAPGIGPVAAATLLALLPELGQRSPKTIAALAGLAPLNRDSGLYRGQRTIGGGRRRVREALYMAAVSAARSKSRFAQTYQALRAAGKPPKLAFIAVARKLLIALNGMLRDQVAFAP